MKCRALKRARSRRAVRGRGLGRGAIGGARNIDPKSAPSTASPVAELELAKNFEVASLWLALPFSSSLFLARRATAMNRDTRLGSMAAATLCTKRDTDFAAWGTRLAICWNSRPGSDCKKREPVSVRAGRAPALRGPSPKRLCGAAHIRARARSRAARPRHGV